MTLYQEIRRNAWLAKYAAERGRFEEALNYALEASRCYEWSLVEALEVEYDRLIQEKRQSEIALEKMAGKTPYQYFHGHITNWAHNDPKKDSEDYACIMSRLVAELICCRLELKKIERKLFL